MTIRKPVTGPLHFGLILPLALVTALDAMAIDMYLPGMPAIAAGFSVSPGRVQQTLAVFLAGLAIGQAIYGPLLDRFGRRKPLLIGIGIFVLGSVVGALAPSVEWLLAARFIQALGAAAGLVAPRAIIADTCDLAASARVFSLLMQVMMVAPVLAPVLGGYLLGFGSWRLIFWMLAGLGLAGLVWAYMVIPDTLAVRERTPLSLRAVAKAYKKQMQERVYVAYVLAGGFVLGSLFLYISGSAFVLTGHFGMSPAQFSYVFAANSVALIFGGIVSDQLCRSGASPYRVMLGSLAIHITAAVVLSVFALGVSTDPFIYLALLALAVGALGGIFGNLTALTMNTVRQQAGIASALLGTLQYLISAIVGYGASLGSQGPAQLPFALALCGVMAALICLLAKRIELRFALREQAIPHSPRNTGASR
ncbi:multidrug effflux MFS transporter [Massilia sp. BSC265]|uniref:multidrug effflux MFS transporter n=1 Tax=Massilia sp. BSC265 TaxID=1549812 RepID=UPI00068B8EF7|nr:multidrug effflux MFS transporter [Massilia sp. BSC265]